jgi:ferredoxin
MPSKSSTAPTCVVLDAATTRLLIIKHSIRQQHHPHQFGHTVCHRVIMVGAVDRTQEDQVTYVITEPCVDVLDKSCVDVCPVDCIHFEERADRMLFINPEECIDCGACEPACPVKAIYPEDAVPEDMTDYTKINAQWYQDPKATRTLVNRLKPEN